MKDDLVNDTISRAAALNCVYGTSPNKIKGRIAELPSAQPTCTNTVPVDDCISRQAALDALGEEPPVWYDGEEFLSERIQWRRDVNAIKAVPSIQSDVSSMIQNAINASTGNNAAQPSVSKTETVGDVISRQAMINEINLHVGILYDSPTLVESLKLLVWSLPPAQPVEDIHREKEQAYYCGYEDGAKAARSAQPGWIPVTERLPDGEGRTIVTTKWDDGCTVSYAYYWGAVGKWGSITDNVIAWMPLPTPYRGGGQENA